MLLKQKKPKSEALSMTTDTFMLPAIHNKNPSYPVLMWNDIFVLGHFCLEHYFISKRGGGDDQVSSMWSQSFFYTCATAELYEKVDSMHKALSAHYK